MIAMSVMSNRIRGRGETLKYSTLQAIGLSSFILPVQCLRQWKQEETNNRHNVHCSFFVLLGTGLFQYLCFIT